MAVAPYEIVLAPADVYIAPHGETFPDVEETPSGNWTLIGTLGNKNYTEDGVTIRHNQSAFMFRGLGSTVTRKVGYTEKSTQIEFVVADMKADVYLAALGGDIDNDITTVAAGGGSAGHKSFEFPTDPVPHSRAVLVRAGVSPEGNDFNSQWEIFNAVTVGSPEVVFRKDAVVALRLVYEAIEDSNGFVTVRMQHEAVS